MSQNQKAMLVFVVVVLCLIGSAVGVGVYESIPPSPNSPERKPVFIVEQNNVKVYGVRHYTFNTRYYRWVYFTVPSGEVSWEERIGKSLLPMQTISGK